MIADRCVYFHITPDTGEVFYIGMGSLRRAKNLKDRNRFWRRKVAKHGFPKVLIIAKNLTSEKAVEIEKFWIKHHGLDRLTNISPGGDGVNGFEHSIETRRKISEIMKGRDKGKALSIEHREKLRIAATGRIRTDEEKEKIRNTLKGRKLPEETKIKMKEAKINVTAETRLKLSNANKDKILFRFQHANYGIVICTKNQLIERFELGDGIYAVISGRRKSHKGWKLFNRSIEQGNPLVDELYNDTCKLH